MGLVRLRQVTDILTAAGIACCEEYAAAPVRNLTKPVAAVGVRGYDSERATETIAVQVLSPRKSGGWACQTTAVDAARALKEKKLTVRLEPMTYLSGCDCFEATVLCTMRLAVNPEDMDRGWSVTIDDRNVRYLQEFSAVREGNRRLVGTLWSEAPHGVSPARDGWQIRMVCRLPADVKDQWFIDEPMKICVLRGRIREFYSDACWDRITRSCAGEELTVEYRGFALTRREELVSDPV